jgi:prepilin-type N-terminal cleavage/methylation domain-containing protein
MKLTRHLKSRRGPASGSERGFTLPELLVAIAVFILLLGGIVAANLFGLSMFRMTETKLNATADVRHLIGTLANEIRSCKSTEVGSIKNGEFVGLLDGEKQQGSSLLLYPNDNTNTHIIYFVEPSDQSFRRTTSTPGSAVIIAEQLTNSVVFSAQDHLGNVLTNSQNNRVIHLNLEFYQAPRYMQVANYYKLETSVSRRALE